MWEDLKETIAVLTIIAITALLGYATGKAATQMLLRSSFEETREEVIQKSLPLTVDIKVPTIRTIMRLNITPEGDLTVRQSTVAAIIEGAGVLVSPNGHILTCAHLFPEIISGPIQVTQFDGRKFRGRLFTADHKIDLALLRIKTPLPTPFAVCSLTPLRVGMDVIAIGSPLGMTFTVTSGIVGFVRRGGLNQSDVSINPGNSGGPLFNLKGELIGINSSILPPVDAPVFTGIGFSIPVSTIQDFLRPFRGL